MKASESLAEWLGDAGAQAKTMELAEGGARHFASLPELLRLQADLAAAEGRSAAAVLDAARTFLDDDHAVAACLAPLIEAARSDPFFRPPLRHGSSPIHTGLLLFDRPELMIFLSVVSAEAVAAKRVFRQGGASIILPGTHSLYKFIKSGDATLSIWEAPEVDGDFSSAAGPRCRRAERRRMRDGEMLELDGGRQTFVIDHAVSDIVYLHATTQVDAAPLSVQYDSESLEFVGASSTDEASSRAHLMLSLLRSMDRQDAVPVFEAMLRSPHFYMRWAAMRDFLALDADRAVPLLREMARNDAHPDVREAAAQTLALLAPENEGKDVPCLA
ncbi:MAG TPA: HEAT repeat domain-containing protein [Allosphingosinicella sp.]